MRFYRYKNNRVARRTAVITGFALVIVSHTLSVVDTCGNNDFQSALFCNATFSAAFGAFFFAYSARAAAIGTNGLGRELSERRTFYAVDYAAAAAFGTRFGNSAFSARAFAVGTIFAAFVARFFFASESRFFKRQRKIYSDILALNRSVGFCAPSRTFSERISSEETRKNIAYVKVHSSRSVAAPETACSAESLRRVFRSVSIVNLALFGVA